MNSGKLIRLYGKSLTQYTIQNSILNMPSFIKYNEDQAVKVTELMWNELTANTLKLHTHTHALYCHKIIIIINKYNQNKHDIKINQTRHVPSI